MNESVDSDALVMPSNTCNKACRVLLFSQHFFVFVQQVSPFNLLPRDEARIAGIGDLHAAQHLAHDHLDVLVADLHALQAIHFLHFVGDVTRQCLDAQQAQDVMRVGRAVHDHFALVHHLAVVYQHMLFLGNQEFMRHAIHIGDHQALLALGVLAERDRSGDLGQHARILGCTRFEQLGHARQTAGMSRVLLLSCGIRASTSPTPTMLAVLHSDDGTGLEGHADRSFGAGDLDFLACLVEQAHHGAHALALRCRAASDRSPPAWTSPVTSSICLATVAPSSTFWKLHRARHIR